MGLLDEVNRLKSADVSLRKGRVEGAIHTTVQYSSFTGDYFSKCIKSWKSLIFHEIHALESNW